MQKVDNPESARDQGVYWMLSPRYTNFCRGSSMCKDTMIPHLAQSEFRIIRVSTKVFQAMQSLPNNHDSASDRRES